MTLNILIADDHEVVRQGFRALLEKRREWKVCGEASTGGETIDKAKKLRPDMLLLDLTLPDMNAIEAITKIMHVCPALKIVALATHDSGDLAAKALAAGASGIAMKSDPATDLVRTIENIGQAQPFLSSAAVLLLVGQVLKNRTAEVLPGDLTPRELEILKLRASGWKNVEIARSLEISVKTVDAHRINFMRKLRFATDRDLIQFALRHHFIEN
jgi:DNA-binding NarL/FixJ family response regulator